jgi:hypothetical protein
MDPVWREDHRRPRSTMVECSRALSAQSRTSTRPVGQFGTLRRVAIRNRITGAWRVLLLACVSGDKTGLLDADGRRGSFIPLAIAIQLSHENDAACRVTHTASKKPLLVFCGRNLSRVCPDMLKKAGTILPRRVLSSESISSLRVRTDYRAANRHSSPPPVSPP